VSTVVTPPTADQARRRRRVAALVALALVVVIVFAVAGGGSGKPKRLLPGGSQSGTYDPLAWSSDREQELVRRASQGFSDVVYEKSPGGVVATAQRTARWRPQIEKAASANAVDPDLLEAIVFLESAGRPDVIAGGDVNGAVGLTQILASTATALLGMQVDVGKSKSLTARIAAAPTLKAARKLERTRRRVDERFDPAKSIAAAARYLGMAQKKFGRADLAVASYHMGMGNLDNALKLYASQGGSSSPSYAQLYFDTAPLRKPRAYNLLYSLGDDSSTYLWRVLAAKEIMRLSRDDPARLRHLEALDSAASAGARRLYPNGAPTTSASRRKPPAYGPAVGLRFTGAAQSDFAPNSATEAALVYIGTGVRQISHAPPLTVTSAHGVRLEVARKYKSQAQARAFQFVLDRLQAWNLIAWGRGNNTLAIVVGPETAKVLPTANKLSADAARPQSG
jgi:Transglycosylase SLT domain